MKELGTTTDCDPKYAPFHIIDEIIYNTAGDANLPLTALVPQKIPPDARPVIVRFHGGFWIGGHRLFALMLPQWILDLAVAAGAILLTVDYRLLLESTGDELLSDLAALMHWLPKNLDEVVEPFRVRADLSRIMTTGESAGGWCAVQCALLHGTGMANFPASESPVNVAAAISHYGALDIERPFFTSTPNKPYFFSPNPPLNLLNDHIAAIKAQTVPQTCTGDADPTRLKLIGCAFVQCRIPELMGKGADKYPMRVLDKLRRKPPRMWIWHGTDDTIVPADCSKVFVEKVERLFSDAEVKLSLVPGEHALDAALPLSEGWIDEGVTWVQKHWLEEGSTM